VVRKRGPKPRPAHLHLVAATHRRDRHGDADASKEHIARSAASFGPIEMPSNLDEHAQEAWRKYVAPAWWLDASREAAAIAFVTLWSRFRRDPAAFPTALHGQLRAYMSDLGLSDERHRFGTGRAKTGDEFFD
jgi:hypothetical protein